MGVRALLRRLRSDAVTTVAMAISVTLALMLLAAGPVYSDAVSVAAMRRSVTDVPAGNATISIDVRTIPAGYIEIDRLTTEVITAASRPLKTEVSRMIVSGSSFEVYDSGPDEPVDVAKVAWLESIEQHATIVEGSWPSEGGSGADLRGGGVIDVAVDRRAGASFGLAVGDALELPPRTGAEAPLTVRIVGLYQIDDSTEPFWRGRARLVSGVTMSQQFRTAHLISAQAAMSGATVGRLSASWLSIPNFERLELADVDPIRRRVLALDSELEVMRAGLASDGDGTDEFEVDTVVPALLSRSTRSLTVARAAVIAVVVQLGLLAAYALVLIAGLTVDARRSEVAMLRARGASARDVLGFAVTEAVVLVVPAALIAPRLAAGLLRGFDEFGPIASIDLKIDPRPVGAAWVAVGLAASAAVALLAGPAYSSARRAEKAAHRHSRQRLRAGWQRAGVDVALVGLAAAAFWQLASLGDERAASVRGRFGVDPLVVVAPTFVLLAGSMIALRVIPAIGRFAERTAAVSTGLVGALSGWQFARRPTRYARAGLLIIMAVAIGTFSAAYEATWIRSQTSQAMHQVGADVRVSPNRRTGDSITDLHLIAAHERVTGVQRSVPVVRRQVDVPGADRPGLLLAVDAERASVGDPALVTALAGLAERRPEMIGVAIPTGATRLEASASLVPVPDDPDPPAPAESGSRAHDESSVPSPVEATPLQGSVVATVRDGTGLLHRLDLGVVDDGSEKSTLVADLAIPWPDGSVVVPTEPLAIVDVEFRWTPPQTQSRRLEFEIGAVRASTPRGIEIFELTSFAWRADTTRFHFMPEPPSLELLEFAPERGLLMLLTTGSSDFGGPVWFNLRSPDNQQPRELPAIAGRSWMNEAGVDVGDKVAVEGIRIDITSVEIVAAVDSVPTVDPNREEALVVDLATLQLLELEPGRAITDISEHWLEIDDALSNLVAVEAELGEAPIEAPDVLVEERRRAELTSDPPALGAIGALQLGFIAASVFALVGFVLTTVVSARERRLEFALLRALGLSMRQLGRWMLIEQLALIIVAVGFGTLVGVALGWMVLPLVALTQTGATVYPPVEVVVPWRTIAGLQAALVSGLLATVLASGRAARGLATGSLLRVGDDA